MLNTGLVLDDRHLAYERINNHGRKSSDEGFGKLRYSDSQSPQVAAPADNRCYRGTAWFGGDSNRGSQFHNTTDFEVFKSGLNICVQHADFSPKFLFAAHRSSWGLDVFGFLSTSNPRHENA